jgi:hypothetical protein
MIYVMDSDCNTNLNSHLIFINLKYCKLYGLNLKIPVSDIVYLYFLHLSVTSLALIAIITRETRFLMSSLYAVSAKEYNKICTEAEVDGKIILLFS